MHHPRFPWVLPVAFQPAYRLAFSGSGWTSLGGRQRRLYGEAIAKLSYEDYQALHCPDVWTVQHLWLLQVVAKPLNTADLTMP